MVIITNQYYTRLCRYSTYTHYNTTLPSTSIQHSRPAVSHTTIHTPHITFFIILFGVGNGRYVLSIWYWCLYSGNCTIMWGTYRYTPTRCITDNEYFTMRHCVHASKPYQSFKSTRVANKKKQEECTNILFTLIHTCPSCKNIRLDFFDAYKHYYSTTTYRHVRIQRIILCVSSVSYFA